MSESEPSVVMDPDLFPSFRELILATSEYARYSGGRFRRSSFQSLQDLNESLQIEDDAEGSAPEEEVLDAKVVEDDHEAGDEPWVVLPQEDLESPSSASRRGRRRAAMACRDVVAAFTLALSDMGADDSMRVEFERAYSMQAMEGVINAMVATLQQMKMWPPEGDLDPTDMAFQDTTEPLEKIAARLYNYQQSRQREDVKRRSLTASFLSDFGTAAKLTPPSCETARTMLEEFISRAREYSERTGREGEVRPALQSSLTQCEVARSWKLDDIWEQQWPVFVGVGAIAAVGMAMVAALGSRR